MVSATSLTSAMKTMVNAGDRSSQSCSVPGEHAVKFIPNRDHCWCHVLKTLLAEALEPVERELEAAE